MTKKSLFSHSKEDDMVKFSQFQIIGHTTNEPVNCKTSKQNYTEISIAWIVWGPVTLDPPLVTGLEAASHHR